ADPVAAMSVPHVRPSGEERIDVEISEVANAGMWHGRGEERQVSRRVRVHATLGGEAAKLRVYRESVRAGVVDLVEAARRGRPPRVDAIAACASLATALAAQHAADSGHVQEPEQLQLRRFA
ncbi:MAG: gfo/Idh/MocA family oxidoreductase, partial [Chloroflexota bacterium]